MIPFLNWFFGDVMLPISAVFGVALIATWPRPLLTPITGWLFMRHVRADQRSRAQDSTTPGDGTPQSSSGSRAGVERTGSAPPVPSAPAGTAFPRTVVSAGLHQVDRHG